MKHDRLFALTLFFAVAAMGFPLAAVPADDPLNAFPTAENPVEERVKRLSEDELKAIEIPQDRETVVFSIAIGPMSMVDSKATVNSEPLLRVFADGRIDCGLNFPLPTKRSADTLTKPELTWLLHLAVNECRIHRKTTKSIDAAYQQYNRRPADGLPQPHYMYQVQLAHRSNDLLIPERALVVRKLRAQMKLNAFASLNKYANFLVARAHLGAPDERHKLLAALNNKLETDHPGDPAFRIEHLGAAVRTDDRDLYASFKQVIELGDNRYKQLSVTILRNEPGSEPTVMIIPMEYQKDRPFAE